MNATMTKASKQRQQPKHNELISNSCCQGSMYILRHGVFENIGWTVWKCTACNKVVRDYPKGCGLENEESDN